MTFTLPSRPPTTLHLIRLLLSLPPNRHIRVTAVDWDAGTFDYVVLA